MRSLLGEKLDEHGSTVWLVNTGWTGGPFGEGSRMPIQATRTMLRAALSGELDDAELRTDPIFGFGVPVAVPASTRSCSTRGRPGREPEAYDRKARELATLFARELRDAVRRRRRVRFARPARRSDAVPQAPWRVVIITVLPVVAQGYSEAIRALGHEPVAVITPRRRALGAPPMPFAAEHVADDPPELDVLFAATKHSMTRLLRAHEPDLAICTGFPWLLSQETIDVPRLGIVNGHPSLLPLYRGPFPIAWAVRNGETEIGMTLPSDGCRVRHRQRARAEADPDRRRRNRRDSVRAVPGGRRGADADRLRASRRRRPRRSAGGR